jgi:hypothetical protein
MNSLIQWKPDDVRHEGITIDMYVLTPEAEEGSPLG